ncbi:MAG: TraB/GumN family protein [Hyphomonadaceae bacterium]
MKLIALIAAFFLIAAPADAQEEAFSPALFVVRDADSTLYLYGTMHVRPTGSAWGGANAQRALGEAQEVWTEIDMSAPTSAAAAQMGVSAISLWERLTPTQAARLRNVLKARNLDEGMFARMQPWMAGLMLELLPLLQRGYDAESGVDRQIDRAADVAGKTSRWFETAEQQAHMLADLPEHVQIEILMDSVEAAEAGDAELARIEAAWMRGDLSALEEGDVETMRREFPALYDVVLKRRNDAWMRVLLGEMAGAGVDFVAVGAAHLVGPDGLIAQFEANGYRVTRAAPE